MRKYKKVIVASVVAILFIGTFVFLWMNSLNDPVEYSMFEAEKSDIVKTTIITGKIEPRDEVSIKPQISGIIAEINKEAGDIVAEGEIIARVKVIPDMGQLTSAESRLRLAEINLQQAEVDYDREKNLFDKELVSAEEYDKVKQAKHQAEEEHNAAIDALEVVRTGVSKSNANASSTLIRSTISGLVLDVPVKVGNSVIQSNTFNDGTTIATVADMGDLLFKGNIDETEVGRLVNGMPMKITIGALQDLNVDASLEYISPKAVTHNGANQFEVKAAVKVPEGSKIRSGYSANAEVELFAVRDVVTIPESAIEFEGSETFVHVAKGGDKKNVYERRKVVIGSSDGIKTEIKSGLKIGDKVRGPKIVKED